MIYSVRWINFGSADMELPVLLQVRDGPCSLIAICNVLFLRREMELPYRCSSVSFETLRSLLQTVLHRNVQLIEWQENADKLASYIQQAEDAYNALPSLENGCGKL